MPRPAGLYRSGPPQPSSVGFAPAVTGGKFALPAARGAPPALHLPSPAMQFAAPEPRGEGCAPRWGRPSSHRRPHLLTPLPGKRAVGEGASSSSSSACSRPAGRRGRPVRRHRPMLPARTCPVLPGRADPPPRAPAAALRLRSAPRPRPRAAPLQIPPRPQCTRALALTSPERHMSSLGLRNVPLQRRSGRGRQTLTKCALRPAQQRGRAQGPRLAWFGIGHISEVS